jgi:DnaJ-domain-containing protein 1
MKKSKDNLEHRIQLKKDEIKRYEFVIANYPPDRMEKHGNPFLKKLNNELKILQNELEDREGRREIKANLGYSRIGRNNV